MGRTTRSLTSRGRRHLRRPEINISPLERAGRVVIGAAGVVAGAMLLPSAPSAVVVVLEGLLVAAGLDLLLTGAVGFCPLYHGLGRRPRSLRRPT